MSIPTSAIRLSILFSATLFLCSTSALAQRTSAIDTAGVPALVAHSTSRVIHVEPVFQRPASRDSDDMPDEPTNPAVATALGCLIVGSVGTGIAALAGTSNVVNIIAGGEVVPGSQLALYTAVAG